MRREEQQAEDRMGEGKDKGIRRSELINWYLGNIEDQIESEEELLEKQGLVAKVIDRLCYHVSRCL